MARTADALTHLRRIFLDTAPVIYYVERNPAFTSRVDPVFARIDSGTLAAVTSPVTLAECLIAPIKLGDGAAQQDFFDLIVHGNNVSFAVTDARLARRAAELRVRYNLSFTDSLQAASAILTGCDGLLTNDATFRRITELQVVYLNDLDV